MNIRSIEALKAELQKLTEEGTSISITQEEAEILDLKNAYDQLNEESEVNHG